MNCPQAKEENDLSLAPFLKLDLTKLALLR